MTAKIPISEIADVNPRLPSSLAADEQRIVNFVPMNSVSEEGHITPSTDRRLGDVKKGFTFFANGDVLVAKITPCLENGKAAHVERMPHGIGFGSTEFHVLRPGPRVLGRYLFYMIWNQHFRAVAASRMQGAAGQKRVPTEFIENFRIPLPHPDDELRSLAEQKRITQILDKATLIRHRRMDAIHLFSDLRESLFLHFFGDPATNPKRWPMGTIRDLIAETQYGSSAKAGAVGRYPILRMNNITADGEWKLTDLKYIDLNASDASKYMVRAGDILFNRTNSPELVGKTAVYRGPEPMAFAGYLVRARVNDRAVPDYIAGYLNSRHGKVVLAGMCKHIIGMANINAQNMQDIRIALPPKELQLRYAEAVASVHAKREMQSAFAAEAEDMFASLVQRAFDGRL